VVSNDIRSLAREASDSADKIKETVGGILEQIASLRRDLEQIVDSVEIEVQNNQTVLATFDKVNREVAALGSANDAILQGADSILSAAVDRRRARARSPRRQEASAASRQASTASTEQARGAEDLAAAIEEIASLADALKQQNG
jgi:methyl-accepting chemotaxis protein